MLRVYGYGFCRHSCSRAISARGSTPVGTLWCCGTSLRERTPVPISQPAHSDKKTFKSVSRPLACPFTPPRGRLGNDERSRWTSTCWYCACDSLGSTPQPQSPTDRRGSAGRCFQRYRGCRESTLTPRDRRFRGWGFANQGRLALQTMPESHRDACCFLLAPPLHLGATNSAIHRVAGVKARHGTFWGPRSAPQQGGWYLTRQ